MAEVKVLKSFGSFMSYVGGGLAGAIKNGVCRVEPSMPQIPRDISRGSFSHHPEACPVILNAYMNDQVDHVQEGPSHRMGPGSKK